MSRMLRIVVFSLLLGIVVGAIFSWYRGKTSAPPAPRGAQQLSPVGHPPGGMPPLTQRVTAGPAAPAEQTAPKAADGPSTAPAPQQ